MLQEVIALAPVKDRLQASTSYVTHVRSIFSVKKEGVQKNYPVKANRNGILPRENAQQKVSVHPRLQWSPRPQLHLQQLHLHVVSYMISGLNIHRMSRQVGHEI